MEAEANTTVKCTVQRLGRVLAVDSDTIAIEVEGKTLTLRRDKAEAGVNPGDALRWNGGRWVIAAAGGRETAE